MPRIVRSLIHLSALSTTLIPTLSLAQDPEADSGFTSYLTDGGPVMFVILGLSVVGTAIFIERAVALYLGNQLRTGAFLTKVVRYVEDRQYRQALDACNVRTHHPLVHAVRAGVLRANRREKEIERAMEKEMLASLPRLQKRITIMALLANAATLTGLLGTIFGLIEAFNSVAAATAAERQEALAAGISQAMYTTAFGISVAVPLLFFHHFLSRRQEKIISEVEEGASAVLVALAGRPGEEKSSS